MLRVELFQGDVVRLLVTSLFAIVLVSSHVSAADTEWDGSSSTNWFESANWTDGVPDDGDDVVIKSGCPNYPVLNANGAECKDLEIEDGATITIGSYVLIIRDDLTPMDDDVLIRT